MWLISRRSTPRSLASLEATSGPSHVNVRNTHYFVFLSPSPQVDNGIGKITLPKGFEYEINASVECNGLKVIERRESRPYQRISVAEGSMPTELTFVLPGPPCVLWESR